MLIASRTSDGPPEILHYPDLSHDERRRKHGKGWHSPIDRIGVSTPATVEFRYEIGERGVQPGGKLIVVWRWPFDWGDLQCDDPGSPGYTTVRSTAAGRLQFQPRYQWIGGIEPWHHMLEVKIVGGGLRQGDEVCVTCGDTAGGSPGWHAPTCAARHVDFLMLIDHAGDNRRARLVDNPAFEVVADEAVKLGLVTAADAVSGQPQQVTLRAEDVWGNVTNIPQPSEVTAAADDTVGAAQPGDRFPVESYEWTPHGTGEVQLRATAGHLTAISNRVRVHATAPPQRLFWGDLHSGQTEIGCGAGTLDEHYTFGRECAGLQFITHQANDHYVTRDDWLSTREITRAHDEPGRYLAILGCEWSPLTVHGGDRNVFYRDDEPALRRSGRFFEEQSEDPEPDRPTGTDFIEAFSDLPVLVNIHAGGRPTNLDWHAPAIEKLCEVHSTHGTSDWFLFDALQRGYRVGVTAGTDGVMGRPGACAPGRRLIRNVRNGLTAVYAKELTKEALWEALHQRRCYGATDRIRLWFEADGHPLGAEYETQQPPTMKWSVSGVDALESIELLRGVDVIQKWRLSEWASGEDDETDVVRLRVLWGGTQRRGTARLQRAAWSGRLQVSSGALRSLGQVNQQSPIDTVEFADPQTLIWCGDTAGNSTGANFEIAGADDAATVSISTGDIEVVATLADVRNSAQRFAGDGINRFVELGPQPLDGSLDVEGQYCDESQVDCGEYPYWIRVTQINQERAWSSPVYVRRR
ncbi:MAG: hypothetical protein QGG36_27775 [Pirellulaceae bacterium]|jgi:hypothetical protein|nr:hypothetical protein [Pirellulaceae bacterium]MDP7019627.1 hypothetical protein [Pirellulaceae bacterium]